MTPEQRREQAEKEVREKLESIFNEHTMAWDCDFYPEVQVALQEAYELGKLSQTIALAEAQERIAGLEKYVQHLDDCEKWAWKLEDVGYEICRLVIDDERTCTCGLAALKGE